ncbi:2397_t:CDS:2, partial [Paraglomus occultum]
MMLFFTLVTLRLSNQQVSTGTLSSEEYETSRSYTGRMVWTKERGHISEDARILQIIAIGWLNIRALRCRERGEFTVLKTCLLNNEKGFYMQSLAVDKTY